MNWRSGLITGWQRINVLPQRLRNRNHDALCGLSRPEADLVLTQIQVVPSQRRDISQPLSGIQSKQDQAPPFRVYDRKDALNFCDRKRTPLVVEAFANRVDKLARVLNDVAIPFRLAKQRLVAGDISGCFLLSQFSMNPRTVADGTLSL